MCTSVNVSEKGLGILVIVIVAFLVFAYLFALPISWDVITVLISVIVGALLAFYLQTIRQKRSWKRDAILKKIDDIYGPLYEEITRVSDQLSKSISDVYEYDYAGSEWLKIKDKYYYLLIDPKLRDRLDKFYEAIRELNKAERVISSNSAKRFVHNIKAVFGEQTQNCNCRVETSKEGIISHEAIELNDSILKCEHPLLYYKKKHPHYDTYKLTVQLWAPGNPVLSTEQMQEFDKVVTKTINDLKADPTYIYIRETKTKILKDANHLKDELRRIIEEPWNL